MIHGEGRVERTQHRTMRRQWRHRTDEVQEDECTVKYIVVWRGDYRRGFGLVNRFIAILYTVRGATVDTALSLLYTHYSSPLHTHCDSKSSLAVSWQRIYQSHCNYKSHIKSSFHSLIPLLPLFCNCQFRRLDSIQIPLLPSSYSGRLASGNSTLHFRILFCTAQHFFITILHVPRIKHSLYC
jgi:hypothetical protein